MSYPIPSVDPENINPDLPEDDMEEETEMEKKLESELDNTKTYG